MGVFKRCISVGLLVCSSRAVAEPRQQLELTSLLGSGNVLGEATASEAMWETLGGLRSHRENRARVALSRHDAGSLRGLGTSAVLRVDLGLDGLGQGEAVTWRDASSWLGIAWQLSAKARLGLRAFPFDTDYLRLGYLHALDWGGTARARHESAFVSQTGGAPGLESYLETRQLQLFGRLKWATQRDELLGSRRLWGVAAGGGLRLASWLRIDSGFGFFQRQVGFLEGASLRVVWHRGASEPELTSEPFRPPSLREEPTRLEAAAEPGLALALETALLVMRQRRTDTLAEQALTAAPAAAIYGSVRRVGWAAHAAIFARSLAFVQHADERVTPTLAVPGGLRQQAELGAWVGGSVSAPFQLVPSAELGARLPAALQAPSVLPGYAQTLVAGGVAGFEPLPVGAGRLPVLAARAALRFKASASVGLAFVVDYQRDANRSRFVTAPSGVMRTFAAPDSLELRALAQARF